ncbi:MAG: SDR family NAD(P)-dependent oxidoreductase [Solirubrobacterales bacterium]|nr:SDR family NAD(P)-dependent oxidoreductase [Solirubrobacterales bacterium]
MGLFLITGSSTGIGRASAVELDRRGHTVLAAVRRPEDAPTGERIEPIVLDVTDAEHLAALAERLGGTALDGLVNNAGIVVSGALEELDAAAWERQFAVNVVALTQVTRIALPSLRAARGRVVNVGSIGAVVAPPFVTPYVASKGAVRSLSASLRRELLPLGVKVVLVEPGAIDTPIWQKGLDASDAQLDELAPELRAVYGARLAGFRRLTEETSRGAISVERCASVIAGALLDRRPPAQVYVGRTAKLNAAAQVVLPTWLFDRIAVRMAGG